MAALAARSETPVALTGSKRLAKRPIGELLDALRTLGATARPTGAAGLPVEIRGPIHGGSVELDVSQSSQFASALLLTLPTLREDSSIHLRGTLVSEPYMEATLAVLAYHGISATRRGRHIRIPGRQRFRRSVFRVPGDASSAAYLWAAAALGGGRVRVHGISEGWPQADLAVLDLLGSAGAAVERASDGATVAGVERRPFRVDLTDAPDLYPLAGVLAATTSGESRISGAEHVVWKESDRREGTAGLARQFGARARVEGSSLVVTGTDRPRPIVLAHSTDHRVVMSAAVGALAASDPSRVGEAEAVRKSFPEFWNALSELSRGRQRW